LPRNDDVTAFGGPCGTSLTTDLAPCTIQLAGNPTRNTPKWSYSLHAEFDLPLGSDDVGTFTLGGDMSGRSDIFFTEFARLTEGSRAYTMFDGWLRWRSANRNISVQAWMKNITNTFRPTSTFAVSTGRLIGATYLPPRTYGLSVGYSF
jgi:iron complex outermembrane receptor protein